MLEEIRKRLTIETSDTNIEDAAVEVMNYCNLKELPSALYGFVARKIDRKSAYESNGITRCIKTISEGDTSITYSDNTEDIYNFSQSELKTLQRFRRIKR